VLAALRRAALHARLEAVPSWTLLDHLDLPRRSGRARAVGAALRRLEHAGLLARTRRHGAPMWSLTPAGRRELSRAGRAASAELPESPQHRAWRQARTAAAEGLERFGAELQESFAAGARLLTDPGGGSDAWLALAEQLHAGCRRMGSALHCLHEWSEPDDARPDTDERRDPGDQRLRPAARAHVRALRAGRRNVLLWDAVAGESSPDPGAAGHSDPGATRHSDPGATRPPGPGAARP
jgi:hypothetical protein